MCWSWHLFVLYLHQQHMLKYIGTSVDHISTSWHPDFAHCSSSGYVLDSKETVVRLWNMTISVRVLIKKFCVLFVRPIQSWCCCCRRRRRVTVIQKERRFVAEATANGQISRPIERMTFSQGDCTRLDTLWKCWNCSDKRFYYRYRLVNKQTIIERPRN